MKITEEPEWSWNTRPTTDEEYDTMMVSLDRHLASLGINPEHRSLRGVLTLSSTLSLSGTPIFGDLSKRHAQFSDSDLLAGVHYWYEENYGERNKVDLSPGSVVVSIHDNLWEMKLPRIMGSARFFIHTDLKHRGSHTSAKNSTFARYNILCSVQGLTQTFAKRLSNEDLRALTQKFLDAVEAITCLENLTGHNLFTEAKGDYRHSVEALLTGHELSKARWETAQCAEKVMKGLLARDGHAYPTFGPKGHDIENLGQLIEEKLGIRLPAAELTMTNCSAAVRYGEEKTSVEQAIAAHDALLYVLGALAKVDVNRAPNQR